MSTLILHLPLGAPGPHTEFSYTLTADGHTALRAASAAPALLPEPSRPGGEVVAVVPASMLSWQRVQLPQGALNNTQRLRATLDGLLEERLLDDTALLHFALAPDADNSAPVWIAICPHAWLQANLQVLEAAGRPVSRIVPEWAPGATSSGAPEWFTIGPEDTPQLVLTGIGAEQAVLTLPLSAEALPLARSASGLSPSPVDGEAAPVVWAEPAVVQQTERLLGNAVQMFTLSQRALAAARGPWDLAQFNLASSGRTRALRKAGSAFSAFCYAPQWRAVRWGLGVLVVAHVLGLNLWAWQESQSLAAKEAGVRQTLAQTFPQIKVVVDAPVQMERELALLRQSAGSVSRNDLEAMLSAASSALPAGSAPSKLEFKPGQLQLGGITLDAAALDLFNTRLRSLGYSASADQNLISVRTEATP